jgi:hypothetical protein
MDTLLKICKICLIEKTFNEYKPHRKVCRRCDSKINYNNYKNKFHEYYILNQDKRIQYQKEYREKKNVNNIKRGRPKKIIDIVEIIEINE